MKRWTLIAIAGGMIFSLGGCVPNPTPEPLPTVSLDDCSYLGQALSSVDSALVDEFSRLDAEPLVVATQLEATSKQFLSDTAPITNSATRKLVDAIAGDFEALVRVVNDQAKSPTGIDASKITSAVSELQDAFQAGLAGCSNVQPTPSPTPSS